MYFCILFKLKFSSSIIIIIITNDNLIEHTYFKISILLVVKIDINLNQKYSKTIFYFS